MSKFSWTLESGKMTDFDATSIDSSGSNTTVYIYLFKLRKCLLKQLQIAHVLLDRTRRPRNNQLRRTN